MNEAEIENKPVEDGALFDMEDFKAAEAEEETIESVEDTTEPTTEEVSTPTETKEGDYSKLLEQLSGKIKYMDQEVKIENVDDLIKNVQKGLDYDRKTEKLNEIENSEEMNFLKEEAKAAGMDTKQYIKALKEYKAQQEQVKEAEDIQRLIDEGVSENTARRMIEAEKKSANAERLAKEVLAEREARKVEEEIQKRKEAENEEFLNAYPSVDIKTIPAEVFKEAEKSNLLTAYTKYQNQQLLKEIELLKQNKKNDESSPIKGTTEHGGVVIEKEDDFLKGLLG